MRERQKSQMAICEGKKNKLSAWIDTTEPKIIKQTSPNHLAGTTSPK